MQNLNSLKVCQDCGSPNNTVNNFCVNCGRGFGAQTHAVLNKNLQAYLIFILFYLIIDNLLHYIFNFLFTYNNLFFEIYSKVVGYIDKIVWASFPLVTTLLLPKTIKPRVLLIVQSSIYLLFIICYFVYYEFLHNDFVKFQF